MVNASDAWPRLLDTSVGCTPRSIMIVAAACLRSCSRALGTPTRRAKRLNALEKASGSIGEPSPCSHTSPRSSQASPATSRRCACSAFHCRSRSIAIVVPLPMERFIVMSQPSLRVVAGVFPCEQFPCSLRVELAGVLSHPDSRTHLESSTTLSGLAGFDSAAVSLTLSWGL